MKSTIKSFNSRKDQLGENDMEDKTFEIIYIKISRKELKKQRKTVYHKVYHQANKYSFHRDT